MRRGGASSSKATEKAGEAEELGSCRADVRLPLDVGEEGSTEVGEEGEPGVDGGVLAALESLLLAPGDALRALPRPHRERGARARPSSSLPSMMISSSTSLESLSSGAGACSPGAEGESTCREPASSSA